MAKTILGIDIGHDQLKLALVKGKRVQRVATADMPENLMRENRITSRESMAELLRNTMKQNKLHANHAAFVLPNEAVFIKNVEMPPMTVDQLVYNLPFEFNDYITGERKEYVFDYAVVSDPETTGAEAKSAEAEPDEGEEGAEAPEPVMELLAVGVHRSLLEDAQDTLRKAGLRLVRSAPALCSYIELIRAQKEFLSGIGDEFGILDLGHQSIRMYMFKNDRHVATRVLEVGMSRLDDVLADAYGVDAHLAHTYLMSNYDNCQDREECHTAYEGIAVELMRAMNFYRFSNPNSVLSDLWLCGGGAVIQPLADTIGEMLDLQLHPATELVPGGDAIESCNSFVQAIGIAMS
ncbi:MAG: pilus assembly protein PilM [Clostridia bacterium]|nr:pilus assembly protein PilM [Clostridia bacterium]